MEYLIVVGVSFIFGGIMLVVICWLMLLAGLLEETPYSEEERATDDAALDAIRGELERQTAPWRQHVRGAR